MIRRVLLAAWLLACLGVVIVTEYAYSPESDIGQFFIGAMLLLTFPSGLLIVGAVALVAQSHSMLGNVLDLVPPRLAFALIWLGMVGLGYAQWFVLLPWLGRKWLSKRASSTVQ